MTTPAFEHWWKDFWVQSPIVSPTPEARAVAWAIWQHLTKTQHVSNAAPQPKQPDADDTDAPRGQSEELRQADVAAVAAPSDTPRTDKPWHGAPRTDEIWKRHTEDPRGATLEGGELLAHELAQYYEMACHACDLEKRLAEARRDLNDAGDGDTWREACKRVEAALAEAQAKVKVLEESRENWMRRASRWQRIADQRAIEVADLQTAAARSATPCSAPEPTGLVERIRWHQTEAARLMMQFAGDPLIGVGTSESTAKGGERG